VGSSLFEDVGLEELKEMGRKARSEVSKWHNKQMALKVNLNSAYGVLTNAYFRYYDFDNAEAITLSGQLSIRWIEKALNSYINKAVGTEGVDYVIASDTDSIYLKMGPLVDKVFADKNPSKNEIVDFLDKAVKQGVQPYIDKSYQELADYTNSFEQKMSMKRESIADKGFWRKKKHYVLNIWDKEGVRFSEPKIEVKGIAAVRSSTPSAVREALKEIFRIIMNKTEQEFQDYVENFRQRYREYPIDVIAKNSGINNMVRYADRSHVYRKGAPQQVRGALLHNKYIEQLGLTHVSPIYDGDKAKIVMLIEPNPVKDRVIAFVDMMPKEFALEEFIDWEGMFLKTFLEPLQKIVDSVGWMAEKRSNLDDCWE
jgi:DNA polymerase elongation subunit (family B)